VTRPAGAPSTDETFQALSDRQRRQVLRRLLDSDGAVTLDRLVEDLAGDGAHPSESADRLRLQLRHVHLPALRNAGLVEYDARNGSVRGRPDELAEELLRVCSSN
jgi:DNA-binding transcriptional ArsR family regulator